MPGVSTWLFAALCCSFDNFVLLQEEKQLSPRYLKSLFAGLPPDTLLKAALLVIWVAGMFLLVNYRPIKLLKKLAPHFQGSLAPYSLFIPALSGQYKGLSFYIHISPKSLEYSGALVLRLHARSFATMRVYRRSFAARAASKTRLFQTVKTGDPAFDAELLVFASQSEIVKSVLGHPEMRNALRQLFDYGFHVFVADKRSLWVEKLKYDRKSDLDLARVSAVLDLLKLFSTGI